MSTSQGVTPIAADRAALIGGREAAREDLAQANPAHDNLKFSKSAAERLEWLRTRYPKDHQRALILPVLSMAQREFGWVSPQVVQFVADQIPVPVIQVEEVATFYTMYNKRPTGRWHLQVCHNISCAIMGADIVIEHLEGKLGIEADGSTTEDGEFTLTRAECLGSCGTAPMLQCNDHYYENLSLADCDELLETLRNTADVSTKKADLPLGPGSGPSRAVDRAGAPLRAGEGVVVPGHDHGDHDHHEVERPRAVDPDNAPEWTARGMAK
jgi:NADH-quinone oxidoreductase subunit E